MAVIFTFDNNIKLILAAELIGKTNDIKTKNKPNWNPLSNFMIT